MQKRLVSFLVLMLLLAGCAMPAKLPALPFGKPAAKCAGLNVGLLIADAKTDTLAAEQMDGYELAAQEINAKGGIAGCPIQLVTALESAEDNLLQTRQAVRDLVEYQNVIAILGGTSSAATLQAASIINFFETPLLVPSAGGKHILPTENLWAFRLHASEETYANTVFSMVKEQLGEGKSVVVVFEDSTEGHDAAVAAVNAIEAQALVVAGYFPVGKANTNAYQTLAAQMDGITPDVLYLIFSQAERAADVLFTLEGGEQAYKPTFTIARAGGFASHAFLYEKGSLKPIAQNLIFATQWVADPKSTASAQLNQAFADYTQQKYGQAHQPTLFAIEAYKSLNIVASTAERALTTGKASPTETKKLRGALREELFAYQENSLSWGKISFSAGGQNPGEVSLTQVIGQKLVTIYPASIAEQPPVPITNSP